ncbi:MAG: sigma-70 family RNA polymerase sigma factor [Ignavibacteria bacterium]|nr:sigma-70 family RNA polymerase sigma factor [Ignavibacteria bacterium]
MNSVPNQLFASSSVFPVELNDHDAVKECLRGNKQAFEVIVDRYQKPIYNLILRMVRDPEDAADLTQTVFVRAYEKLKTFDPRQKFFSWLYRIAINTSLNFVNQRKHTVRMDHAASYEDMTAHDQYEKAERAEKLGEALMRLRPEYRAIVILRHFHDLSYWEIGKILDVPEKTVKSRLFSARQLLRTFLVRLGL